jgi:siroheme synthase-like protein
MVNSHYYPVLLDLRGRPCLVFGGGTIATGKVEGLLEAGARVTVIAPELSARLRALAAAGQVLHLARAYRPGDLDGAFLVVAATDDRFANAAVWEEANARSLLINAVDDVPHCNFIAPSTLRQGDLIVAISTSGKAPALAVRLKERLAPELGAEYARFLELAGEVRAGLAVQVPDLERRKALWYDLVDSDVLERLRQGDEAGARARIEAITGVRVGGGRLPPDGSRGVAPQGP